MSNNIRFAFLVHARYRTDLIKKFPILKILPNYAFDWLTLNMRPFIVSKITGLINQNNEMVEGIIVGIPMTAHQLLENRELASKRIVQASILAKSKGARFIGLGAMTTSLSRGGRDVIEKISDIFVTTGRTYTTKNISEYVDFCVKKFSLDKNKIKIGIVGAAGGIGSGVAIVLARKGYKDFTLIDLERKLDHLRNRIEVIERHSPNLTIRISHKVSIVSECDIIIAATNAPEVIIKSEDVSAGTIIINDAQPSDISPEILEKREDVIVIEGGVLKSKNIDCHFNMGLADRNDIFSCLAETLILTHKNSKSHYSIDDFDPNLFEELEMGGNYLGFEISQLQNDHGYISEQNLEKFARIIRERHK